MAIPHRCPVCNGTGLVPVGFYTCIGSPTGLTNSVAPGTCRSCNGTGIVWDCWGENNPYFAPSQVLYSPIKPPATGDPLPPENPTICGDTKQ